MAACDNKGKLLQAGDKVRVIMRGSPRATVESFMNDIEGGVVLDRPIDGTHCWNGPRDLVKIDV